MPTSDNTRSPITTKSTKSTKTDTKSAVGGKTDIAARKRATKKPRVETAAAAGAPKSASTRETVPAVTAPPKPAAPAVTASQVRHVAVGIVRPDPDIAKVIDTDERRRMIAEAAYHKFLQRGPGHGSPSQDWCDAEAEIDALLTEQQTPHAQ